MGSMGQFCKNMLVLAAAMLFASGANGQADFVEQLWLPSAPFLRYTTTDGLSQSDISAIAQDRAGHLWLATARGVNRFDGITFTHYTIADGLPRNDVTAVNPAQDGRVWVGDSRGNVALIRGDAVERVVDAGAARGHRIEQIIEHRGQLYVATDDAGLFTSSATRSDTSLTELRASASQTRDLAIYQEQLWFIQDDTLVNYSLTQTGAFETVRSATTALALGDNDSLWLATSEGQLLSWTAEASVPVADLPDDERITQMAAGKDGTLWVSTREGVYGYSTQSGVTTVRQLTRLDKGLTGAVIEIFVDRENTLWLAGDAGTSGLVRHLGDRFRHYHVPAPDRSRSVWSIAEDSRSNRYVGTSDTLYRLSSDGIVSNYSAILGLPETSIRAQAAAADNELWVGTHGNGLYQVNTLTNVATHVPGTEGLVILDLAIDSVGVVWLGTAKSGVVSVDSTDISRVQQFDVLNQASVYTLAIDNQDNVWFGLDYLGISRFKRLSRHTVEPEFYGQQYGLGEIGFGQITVTGPESLWVGGENGALLHFDNGLVRDYSLDSPLLDQTVYTVFQLDSGALLLGGEKGVFYFDPITLESRRFGPLQGFIGMETNVHASLLDHDGQLWLGTIDGVARMDIDKPLPLRADITPKIISSKSQKSQSLLSSGATIESKDSDLRLEFDAVSLQQPGSLEYSFRLTGRDDQWSPPGLTRSVSYSGLTPGAYRFEVRSRYPGSDWHTNSNAFSFTVLAPIWREPWFLTCALILAAFLLYSTIRLRTRSVERMNLRLRAEVEERTRSIEKGRIELLESNRKLREQVEERRLSDAARAEVEARFRVAFQSTPIGMALIDINGRLLNSNRALRQMFLAPMHHDNEETTPNALEFIDEDDRETLWAEFQRILSGEIDTMESEYICRRFDGEALFAKLSLTSVRDERDNYKYCIAQVQDITESRQLTDALEYQANFDELSGLLNRRSFEKALNRAYKQSLNGETHSYLLFMDLDQFKIVNDTSGHSAGDELLRQVSALIREEVRVDDIAGRLGGDEFGLILWQCPTEVAYRIAEAIRTSIEAYQFQWDSETYRIGISIGAVAIDAAVGSIAEIQQMADAACYQAKENGRNRVYFAREQGESIDAQRGEARWVQRLHDAMDNNRFALYGQIIKPTRSQGREPERMEILLRMREPKTRKLIPPGAFLPAAERYGLSVRLDVWVVRSLLKMLYVHEAFGASDRRYWINLSGTSVGDRRFGDFLIDAVKNCGLPVGMINFEITETAVIRNVGEAGRLMAKLREMGCQFALDDFGSGLSSFGYLKKLPVDYIKIDGMFVRDILTDEIDRIFVKSIIDISHTMGIKTIAEFVENTAIMAVVSELGADYVQGFGVHRPELIAPEFPASPLLLDRQGIALNTSGIHTKEKRA